MESITFSTPTLPTASMTKADQVDLMLNQATAVVVCCYLEHMNTAINKGLATSGASFINQTELVALVDAVQGALKSL